MWQVILIPTLLLQAGAENPFLSNERRMIGFSAAVFESTHLTFLKYFNLRNIETIRLPNQEVWVYSLIHWKICWKACHYSFRNCPSFSYRTPLKYAAPHLLAFYKKPRWISLSALFNRATATATTEKENKACRTFPHSVVLINITGYETHFQG